MNHLAAQDLILVATPLQTPQWSVIFGNHNPLKVEIGPGKGRFLIQMAQQQPQCNFVGVEIRRKRVLKIASKAARAGLSNLRVIHARGEDALAAYFPPASVHTIFVHFPDPWPKRRHAKRRLFTPLLLESFLLTLVLRGEVIITTDVASYAHHILELFKQQRHFTNVYGNGFGENGGAEHQTIHEEKFKAWGRRIYYLRFYKNSEPDTRQDDQLAPDIVQKVSAELSNRLPQGPDISPHALEPPSDEQLNHSQENPNHSHRNIK